MIVNDSAFGPRRALFDRLEHHGVIVEDNVPDSPRFDEREGSSSLLYLLPGLPSRL
jgi:hypothetical protein